LSSPSVTVSGSVSAIGGPGGLGSAHATGGAGGAGGLGRIRVSATPGTCTLGGSFNPPVIAGCTATNKVGATFVGVYPN
jgi:hypothetical protein